MNAVAALCVLFASYTYWPHSVSITVYFLVFPPVDIPVVLGAAATALVSNVVPEI